MNIFGILCAYVLTFFSAYFVSAKTRVWFQVFNCLFWLGVLIMAWSEGSYFDAGAFWLYSGWAGYMTYKVERGIIFGAILERIVSSIKSVIMSLVNRWNGMIHGFADKIFPNRSGREERQNEQRKERPKPSRENTQQSQSETYRDKREKQYWQQQEEFRQRQRTREQAEGQRQHDQQKEREKQEREQKEKPKQKRPWWEVLEVSKNADMETIKKSYRTMTKRYHPDKVAHFGEAFRAKAEEAVKEINAAFDEAKKRRS